MYPNSEGRVDVRNNSGGWVCGGSGVGRGGWGGGGVKELNLVNTMQFYLHITSVRIGAVTHQRINIEYKLINFTKQ